MPHCSGSITERVKLGSRSHRSKHTLVLDSLSVPDCCGEVCSSMAPKVQLSSAGDDHQPMQSLGSTRHWGAQASVAVTHSHGAWVLLLRGKLCLGQNRKRQHFPCHESAGDLGPRDVGLSVQSSSCSRNPRKLHLIWSQCPKRHRWVRNALQESKSGKDFPPSLCYGIKYFYL